MSMSLVDLLGYSETLAALTPSALDRPDRNGGPAVDHMSAHSGCTGPYVPARGERPRLSDCERPVCLK